MKKPHIQLELEKMRLLELKLFVIEFSRASQLGRSISKNKRKPKSGFRKALIKTCLALIKEMDDKTLSNAKIRKGIKNLSERYGVSYGQAQKVVNVCLKQYMFITQNYEFSTELDCPLDSTTMKGCKISNNKMISVNADDYEKYQSMFSENFELKVLKDKKYDEQRIANFMEVSK